MSEAQKDEHNSTASTTPSGISGAFHKAKHFFTDAPKMPSNRTAAVGYGDKLKDPMYNPAAASGSGPETSVVLTAKETGEEVGDRKAS